MSKKFSFETFGKDLKKFDRQEKVTVNGYDFLVDAKFKLSKMHEMGEDFLGVFFYLNKENVKTNIINLINFFVIKHFCDIGNTISSEIEKRTEQANMQDEYLKGVVRAKLHLAVMKELIDGGIFEGILNAFDSSQLNLVYSQHEQYLKRMSKQIEEDSNKTK